MSGDISQFHFLRPLWLTLLPVLILGWHFGRLKLKNSSWENYLPKSTIQALSISSNKPSRHWQWWMLASLLALVLAAAGPTWSKQEVPIVKNQNALVVILDLSPSMLAEDLKPDRLTRAKYKLIDIINKRSDGQVALIAYAGDAHTVSPLTDDPATIEALLTALHPNIMPSQGSNTEAAVALAQQLLQDARISSGQIVLITDGITQPATSNIRNILDGTISLSILGVGGAEPAPVPSQGGGFLKNNDGEIVLAGLNISALSKLATGSGGRFSTLQLDESDVNYLLRDGFESSNNPDLSAGRTSFDNWADMGHWLVLLVLPFAVFCFRKGVIYVVPVMFILPFDSPQAAPGTLSWNDLWRTPDQQAARLMQQEKYAEAAERFQRKDWSAIANYRSGNFSEAASQFGTLPDADVTSLYNKANALAFMGELQQAIDSYQQVLAQQADHADAAHNKNVLEQLLEQQSQQKENQPDNQDQQDQQGQQGQQQENQPGQQDNQQSSSNNSPDSAENQSPQASEGQPSSGSQQSQTGDAEKPPGESEQAETGDDSGQQPQTADQDKAAESSGPSGDQAQSAGYAKPDQGTVMVNENSAEQLKDSSEQWLRTIPDDPGGLLRRKFEYQAWQRAQQQKSTNQPGSNSVEDRY